jgi:NodT family efflux transporter outer membrane factor (OMF) lipoprotein
LSAGAALLAGCLPYSTADRPEPPVETAGPYAAGDEAPPRGRPADERWWLRFEDPGLAAAIERSVGGSLELRSGFARVRAAESLARQAHAAQWPQVSVQGTASHGQSSSGFLGTSRSTQLTASLPVSYEVDLFNRIGTEARAAELDAVAVREDVSALAMSVAARVAESWYDLVEVRLRRAVVEAQLATNEIYLELARLRFQQGLAASIDVYQQQQQVAVSRGQLPAIDSGEALLLRQLAVLVGERSGAPTEVAASLPAELPALPPPPPAGLPAELLEGRPDLRAARRRVEAADRRVGAAIASRLPTLVLNGSVGYSWSRTDADGDMFDNTSSGFAWNVAGTVSVPLFDGFRRRAETDVRRARVEEAVEAYGQAVLTAIVEVETALVQERNERARLTELGAQLEAARATLVAARDRYRQGLTDFLPVLNALQSLHQTELAHLEARRNVLSHRIQLHRALGGSWPAELEAPEGRAP